MNTRRLRAALAAASAAVLLLAGCGGGAGGSGGPTLSWAVEFPAHWDPVVQGSGAGFRVLSLVYASLTEIDENGDAQPGLAESWTYNDSGDEVTFHLRPGLTFSDGTPVDADAVAQYLERARHQEDSALDGDLGSIASVTASGAQDVVTGLTQVDYQIPLLLGQRVAQITSPAAAQDLDRLDQWPVGAGPFVVTDLVPESHVVLEKNPAYWDAANIHLDRVEVHATPDASSVVSAVSTGVYDFAPLAPSQARAAQAAGLDVVEQPGFNASNISLNTHRAPFDDPAVVDAVRYAVNREEFVDKVTFGLAEPTTQPFPSNYLAYDPQSADLWPHDPERARQILTDAGYAPGEIRVELVARAEDPQSEIIQSQLGAVGITVDIRVSPDWATPFFAKDLALSWYSTTGRESPVQTLTAHFGPEGPLNLSSPATPPGFAEAVATARSTPLDSPDYAANLQAATRAGLQSSALVFTYSLPNLFVKSPRISGLPPIPGQVHWTGVRIGDAP
ncbi:ABC transporter substrate-binding protein [Pseudonocardia sp. MH-G8]|uniref:ABC transporter substrate-binding protein n=1 Tax=Pseudonocardia sp. MH-G8 TaxID=1854588 RepID=UPI000BA099DC|nr:ABC transporter substrate-binding protein [Pseudonocardia sp. MH-G8]OZM77833.1 peptide ABC transporter permease [Pseudonocardia sp. MH-G8]